ANKQRQQILTLFYCFFFSSRRRHTRFSRDWSSDVCSSDLCLDSFKTGCQAGAMTTRDLEHLLRETGLRVTRPRLAVLRAVHDHPHADTESVIGAVRRDLPAVSHQAVYDSLNALTTAGVVRR